MCRQEFAHSQITLWQQSEAQHTEVAREDTTDSGIILNTKLA